MGSYASKLDDQIVRQLCRQMQDITQVCEGMALKLLDLEARLEQLDASVRVVSVAIEAEGLNDLLDAVGGRLGDLKGLLGIDVEAHHAVDSVGEQGLNAASFKDGSAQEEASAQEQNKALTSQVEVGEANRSTDESSESVTIDGGDFPFDLMSA